MHTASPPPIRHLLGLHGLLCRSCCSCCLQYRHLCHRASGPLPTATADLCGPRAGSGTSPTVTASKTCHTSVVHAVQGTRLLRALENVTCMWVVWFACLQLTHNDQSHPPAPEITQSVQSSHTYTIDQRDLHGAFQLQRSTDKSCMFLLPSLAQARVQGRHTIRHSSIFRSEYDMLTGSRHPALPKQMRHHQPATQRHHSCKTRQPWHKSRRGTRRGDLCCTNGLGIPAVWRPGMPASPTAWGAHKRAVRSGATDGPPGLRAAEG